MMKKREFFLAANGLIGLVLFLIISLLQDSSAKYTRPEFRKAAEIMDQSIAIIHDYAVQHQINAGNPEDPRQTGLIGPEWSDITTTAGDPESKRTTVNPNIAALIAHLLTEAGVKQGDTIAIGSSASFPALLIASLSAAKAMGLKPLVIVSFGSSSFGASQPDFNILDIYKLLLKAGIAVGWPIAASEGGQDDTGSEFENAVTDRIRIQLAEAGIPLISEKNLQENVKVREEYYFSGSATRIKAFINSGGGYANIGSSPSILKLKPGLVGKAFIPEPDKQGMIHAMLLKKIPVIHLLHIKGLAQKYHLPWDPQALPGITEQSVRFGGNRNIGILMISFLGIFWFSLMLIRYRCLFNSRK